MPGIKASKSKKSNYQLFPEEPAQKLSSQSSDTNRHINVLKWIFSNMGVSASMFSPPIIRSLFLHKDLSEFKGIRDEIQCVFNRLVDQKEVYLKSENTNAWINQKEVLINNILSYYAFTEPLQGELLQIPVKLNGEWKLVDYRVDKIRLTSPVFSDPYYAYGLVPQYPNHKVGSKLLFMGTNRGPTSNGSRMSKFADVFLGKSVGEPLYDFGGKKIEDWVDKQYKKSSQPVVAIGTSMGGSLSMITHMHNPAKVKAVAFNPPAFLPKMKKLYEKRLNGATPSNDAIQIYTQKMDFVYKLGLWFPENARMFKFTANENFTPTKYSSHIKSYIAMDPSSVKRIFPEEKNNSFKRWGYTIVWQMLCVPLFFWNLLYIGLKALTFPANFVVGKMLNDPGYVEDFKAHRQKPWQKGMSMFYSILTKLIALPFVLADTLFTAAIGLVGLMLFAVITGIDLIMRKISLAATKKKDAKAEQEPTITPTLSPARP